MSEVSGGKVTSPVSGGSNQDEWNHQAQESAWRHWKTPFFGDVQKTGYLLIPGGIRKKNDGLNQGGTTSLWPDHPSVQTEQLINPGDALRPKGRPACIEAGATEISGFLFVWLAGLTHAV